MFYVLARRVRVREQENAQPYELALTNENGIAMTINYKIRGAVSLLT